MLLIILIIILLFGGGLGYRSYPNYGPHIGIGTVLVIVLVILLLGCRL